MPIVVVSMLSHAELEPNDHQEDAPHFIYLFKNKIWCRLLIPSKVAGAIIGKGGATIKSLRDEVSHFNSIICSLEKTNKPLSHREDLEMSRFSSSHLISGYF